MKQRWVLRVVLFLSLGLFPWEVTAARTKRDVVDKGQRAKKKQALQRRRAKKARRRRVLRSQSQRRARRRHMRLRWGKARKASRRVAQATRGKPPKGRTAPPKDRAAPAARTAPKSRIPAPLRRVKLEPEPAFDKIERPKLPPRKDAGDPTLTLSSVHKMARKLNLDLQILRERVIQAELVRARTWAILKPQLDLQASYTRNQQAVSFNPGAGTAALAGVLGSFAGFISDPVQRKQLEDFVQGAQNSRPIEITPQNQLALRLQLTWAVLNLRSIPLLQIAYLTVDQVGHTIRQARREVMFAVTRAYYNVLLADGLVDVQRESLQNTQESLRIANARYKAGVAPSLLVTRAELDVARAKQALIQSENGLRTAKQAVALLLNKPTLRFRPQRPPHPTLPSGGRNAWLKTALQRRAELKSSRIALRISSKKIDELWLQFLPTLAVQGAFQATNAAGFAGQNTTWSVTLAAQMAIYDGGTRYSLLQDAFSKRRQARLEFAKAQRQIQNELVNGNIALDNAKAALRVAQQQLVLARRNYKLTEERYKTGVATPVEVSDSLASYNSAKINLLRQKLSVEFSILSLLRAMGLFSPK